MTNKTWEQQVKESSEEVTWRNKPDEIVDEFARLRHENTVMRDALIRLDNLRFECVGAGCEQLDHYCKACMQFHIQTISDALEKTKKLS